MDVEKTTLTLEKCMARLEEQVPVESAVPLPEGRTLGAVLLVTPRLTVEKAVPNDKGVTVSGALKLHIVAETEDRVLYSFDAAASYEHTLLCRDLSEKEQIRFFGELLQCACRREDDGLRLSALLCLRAWAFREESLEAVSTLSGAKGLESRSAYVEQCRRTLLGAKALKVREEEAIAPGTAVLSSSGFARIRRSAPATEGVLVEGELLLSLSILTPEGLIKQKRLTLPFTDSVKVDGPVPPSPLIFVELLQLKCRAREEALETEGELSLSVYSAVKSETELLLDAYDQEGSFECRLAEASYLQYVSPVSTEKTFDAPIRVPNHLPEAQEILTAGALGAVTALEKTEDGFEVGGIVHVTTVYRCESGLLHSFTVETPFSLTVPCEGELLLPETLDALCTVTGRGRELKAQLQLLFTGECYRESGFTYTQDLYEGKGTVSGKGVLLYFTDPEETLFSVGKRFGVPLNQLKELNPAVQEPFSGGEKILILK